MDNGADELCECWHIIAPNTDTDDYPLHCIQSREHVGNAAKEGFAHFIAAATFNNRSGGDCAFRYYKDRKRPDDGDPDTDYEIDTPPFTFDCDAYTTWVEDFCPEDDYYLSAEGDWLQFFFNMWISSSGGYLWSIGDIMDIWANVSHSLRCYRASPPSEYVTTGSCLSGYETHHIGEIWTSLSYYVYAEYGPYSDEYEEFLDIGDAAGVDH